MQNSLLPAAQRHSNAAISLSLSEDNMHALLRFISDLTSTDAETNEGREFIVEHIGLLLGAQSVSLFLSEKSETQELSEQKVIWSSNGGCGSQQISLDEINRIGQAIDNGDHLTLQDATMEKALYLPLLADGDEAIGAIEIRADEELSNPDLLNLIRDSVARSFINARQIRHLEKKIETLQTVQGQLIASRNTLRALFDSSPASIYIVDLHYTLVAVNMSRADLVGLSPQVLVGEKCYSALYQRENPCPDCLVEKTLKSGETTRRIEMRRGNDGDNLEFEISAFSIRDDSGQIVQAFLFEEDVTERQQLQASLAQSEKLAAVGQLAAGVAHEINNPLTTILANAQLLQRKIPDKENHLHEMLELIIQGSDRASQAVRALLDFARRERYARNPIDLNQTIDRTIRLLKHELDSRSITLEFEPAQNLPAVVASQDHLQGVWLNLLINAIDAIHPGPGQIQITTRQVEEHVQIDFSDNGPGIRQDHISRVFEPFFTTKETGHGTGLGLAVCHQIVSRHGGQIFVSSRPGEGATFTVNLPLT
jgi:PAS domain S-box-containing protein